MIVLIVKSASQLSFELFGTAVDKNGGMVNAKDLRHQEIIAMLKETGSLSVADLGSRIGVTEITIRRDLEALENAGAVKRYHGGAQLAIGSSYEPPIAVREQTHAADKKAIAARVANLIDDGTTIVLDGGTTGIAIAQALIDRQVTVCPLSLRVAWEFASSTSVRLLMPPGVVRAGELSISGSESVEYLLAHRFDLYVMTASGFSLDHGFSEWNVEDAAVKRTARASSQRTIAAIDASKFGTTCFVSLCAIDAPDVVVTSELPPADLATLEAAAQAVEIA